MELLVGVDVSAGVDNSCVTCICSKCMKVISWALTLPKEPINIPYHEKCPYCGTVFKTYQIN